MADIDFNKRLDSKPYKFFELLYRMLVYNLITAVFCLTLVLAFPAICACAASLSEGNNDKMLKQYFKNFAKYFKKSIGVGIIITIVFAVVGYALYFYINASSTDEGTLVFLSAGFWASLIFLLLLILLSVHLELIVINFNKLSVGEILSTSLFVTFRYFLTTIILFILHAIMIGMPIICIINWSIATFINNEVYPAGMISLWLTFGISLPLFLEVKITKPIYYRFSKIDFDKINQKVDQEELYEKSSFRNRKHR